MIPAHAGMTTQTFKPRPSHIRASPVPDTPSQNAQDQNTPVTDGHSPDSAQLDSTKLEKTNPDLMDAPSNETKTDSNHAIGFALGGGVARGWAHIGALQRLEELGIKPSVVCGTSVGALVGGFWLAGRLDALEAWTRSLHKRRILNYLDIAFKGSGLIGGKKLETAMENYLPDMNIEDLPVKFLAVTTELITGHEIWLRKGSLRDALRAAYALPGIFPPSQIDGRWVIDGALVNPLPVSAARAMNARIVIAIGLHGQPFHPGKVEKLKKYGVTTITPSEEDMASAPHDETDDSNDLSQDIKIDEGRSKIPGGFIANTIFNRFSSQSTDQSPNDDDAPDLSPGLAPGLAEVMMSSFNIMMDRTTRSRLAADPSDIMINPIVDHVPLLGFDQADELIRQGRLAVEAKADHIIEMIEYLG